MRRPRLASLAVDRVAALAASAMLTMTLAAAQATGACEPGRSGDWLVACGLIITSFETRVSPDAEPGRVLLLTDGRTMQIVSTMTLAHYRRIFTDHPTVVAEIGHVPYVVDAEVFCGGRPTLRIGALLSELEPDSRAGGVAYERSGHGRFRVPATMVKAVTSALSGADKAELTYCHQAHGAGYRTRFETAGFVEALRRVDQGGGR